MSIQLNVPCRSATALIGALAIVLPALSTTASAAEAVLSYRIDGGPVHTYPLVGFALPNGNTSFTHSVVDPIAGVLITWNYGLDGNPEGAAYYNGTTVVTNLSSVEHRIEAKVDFSVCPSVEGGSVIGGSTLIKLNTDANGGALTCGKGDTMYTVSIDQKPAQTLFYCPFNMSTDGAGSLTTSANFGLPIPSQAGPENAGTIGVVIDTSVTDGDKVTFSGIFVIESTKKGGIAGGVGCLADFNGDGEVNGFDLTELLVAWGYTGSCSDVDLDLDGYVTSADIALLLNSWGSCN